MYKTCKLATSTLAVLLMASFAASVLPLIVVQTSQAATQTDENVFSIMHISDTQHLANLSSALYNDLTSWIVNNSANYNLKMVVHTGDFIDGMDVILPSTIKWHNASRTDLEWSYANAAMTKLLNAAIPYCWCAGNHDQTPFSNSGGTTNASKYSALNPTAMRSKPYWVSDIYDKNTAVKFAVNNFPFLIVDIEYMANSSAIAWMKSLLDQNPSVNVIVATHGYLSVKADYSASSSELTAWQNALKTTLDLYPNVFLTFSGHVYSSNMTRVGGRQEILFDRQEVNTQTGASSVRIYTFNLTSKKVSATTYAVDKQTWLTGSNHQFAFDASITSDWTLTTEARALKAYPDLKEYIWQKDARMPPNGQYDKIGLHRLVKTGIIPKGVILICPGTNGNAEQLMSNPPNDNYTRYENYSQPLYWANRGFDVYGIDYRTHFVPENLTASQLSFMANWGYDQWTSDAKEAVEKVKEVSGSQKIFLAGISFGGNVVMNHAAKYWQQDLRGIILLDGGPGTANPNPYNVYNLTAALAEMNATKVWANEMGAPFTGSIFLMRYVLKNPGAPALFPGTNNTLYPPVNPITNQTWANITEWSWNYFKTSTSNTNFTGGYGDYGTMMQFFCTGDRWWPARLTLERNAWWNWTNCPYLPYDYDDHYKEIGVPLLGFTSQNYGLRAWGSVSRGIDSYDVTGVFLRYYGHLDVVLGVYSSRDVSQPTLNWMLNRYQAPAATAFSNVTVMAGWTWYFFAHSNGGIGLHTYQWYEGTTQLAGQTSMVLPVMKTTRGIYIFYCKITDSEGATTTSNSITLTVL